MAKYTGYCVKCKAKRDFEGTPGVTKKGQPVASGGCPDCGTKVNTFLKRSAA